LDCTDYFDGKPFEMISHLLLLTHDKSLGRFNSRLKDMYHSPLYRQSCLPYRTTAGSHTPSKTRIYILLIIIVLPHFDDFNITLIQNTAILITEIYAALPPTVSLRNGNTATSSHQPRRHTARQNNAPMARLAHRAAPTPCRHWRLARLLRQHDFDTMILCRYDASRAHI
jgi:hypothetical protein